MIQHVTEVTRNRYKYVTEYLRSMSRNKEDYARGPGEREQ